MVLAAEYLRSVIRIFPDYAESVIWFAPGPVSYDDAKISDELRVAMEAWETTWYGALSKDFTWKSPALQTALFNEGKRLATVLSEEIGDLVDVEFDVSPRGKARIRGHGAGTNPSARRAFQQMIDEAVEEHQRSEKLKASGSAFRWTAYAPGTGKHFRTGEADG